ncbi:MAG TPA: hypothetical protein VF669_23350 [Tepidisphaeraceae bacterium]
MSILLSDELRLLYATALMLIPFLAAYRFSRGIGRPALDAVTTAFLGLYLIQYIAVCVPGLLGILNPMSIAISALLLSALLYIIGRKRNPDLHPPLPTRDWLVVTAAVLFVTVYILLLIHHQAFAPVTSNDALTYHLPAAVQWLQTHRMSLYEAWFYNPANSYSPLAGSTFIAYLLAPMGNDVLARFVESPPLLFMFFALVSLQRRMNVPTSTAALVAAAAVLSRPFLSQAILAKDDLFVAAFLVVAVAEIGSPRDQENVSSPVLAGVAAGLLFATKYTALFSLPILLLAISHKGKPRDWVVAWIIAMLLAGPWYARNWILTGNPLYPTDVRLLGMTIFPGMFQAQRSHLLNSASGVWSVFTQGYYSLPFALVISLIATSLAAAITSAPLLLRDPLRRCILMGAPLSILLFAVASPYGETRFVYPAILLLFTTLAMLTLPQSVLLLIATAALVTSALTAFQAQMATQFTLLALPLTAMATTLIYLFRLPRTPRIVVRLTVSTAAAALAILVYIHWHAYIAAYRDDGTYAVWSDPTVYDRQAELWKFVREELPPQSTIAYTNFYLVYPLMGFNYQHPLIHIPTRKDLNSFRDMPRIARPITGEEIPQHVLELLRENPDPQRWRERLLRCRADYLFISTVNPAKPTEPLAPPEQQFAEQDPAHFQRVFPPANDATLPGVIYRIVRR